jgi:hypothetical protein
MDKIARVDSNFNNQEAPKAYLIVQLQGPFRDVIHQIM